MLEQAIQFLKTISNTKKRYGLDVLDLCQIEGRKVAFHSTCTDGIVSATIIKSIENAEIFIPLDYWILKQEILRKYLSLINWYALVDLEPFNKKIIELFVDHHISSIGKPIQSKKVHMDIGKDGPSAAYVLLNTYSLLKEIPSHLKQLVNISKVTDTASYNISAPVEPINQNDKKLNFDKQIWLLEDACKSCLNVSQNIAMVELLSEKGFNGLFSYDIIRRVNYHRKKRKYYLNYAEKIEREDLMILINPPDAMAQDTIVSKLLENPRTTVTCSLIETQSGVKISLRRSKIIEKKNPELTERIRLDKLAGLMEGGGHPAAAGAISNNLFNAIQTITDWSKNFNFAIKKVNVRAEIKPFK
ncbi:MAG: hypothetical protein HeimC3_52870 [Candidatus Heimdallarchaeota archaeon LC_3]|nr:MAG: hypothetical protein HeimC3_52870 [Candidatus Heimdallarchaeota archaeon LC_3]